MGRYLISFDDGAMDISEHELPGVADDAHRVMREAKAAGVWIFGGGIWPQQASIVAPDGTVAAGPFPETKAVLGGFTIVDVATHDEALQWAVKFAAACRCPQEVREIMFDPEVDLAPPRSAAPTLEMRVARPTRNLEAALDFWTRVVGLDLRFRFEGHDGFDGVILGHDTQPWELELTQSSPESTAPTPTGEDIIVLYVAENVAHHIRERLRDAGCAPRGHANPYWEANGATAHTDPDGYTLIIQPVAPA